MSGLENILYKGGEEVKQVEKHYILKPSISVKLDKSVFSITDSYKKEYYNITEVFKCKEGFYFRANKVIWFGNTPIMGDSRIYPTYWLGLDVVLLLNKDLEDENVFWESKRKLICSPDMFTLTPSPTIPESLTKGNVYDLLEITEYGGYMIRNDEGFIEAYRPYIFEEEEVNE